MSLKALLESKIREYDASIDLTEGSRIQRTVIAPVVDSLSTDPLSVSTRDYLYARFSEAFPDAPITRGNALDDILITACEYFLEGYRAELSRLRNATSLDNLNLLSDDEADALASNWFVTRDAGARATGTVTVTVDRPSAISITTTGVRFFNDTAEYAPTINTTITTDALLANAIGSGQYQFTLSVQAVAVGAEFNAAASRVTRVRGIPNVVSVNNTAPILGGLSRDTTEYLLSNKLPRAISERSLVTARGIGARIVTDVPGILRYQVVGHGDVEMLRDRVEVQSFTELVAAGHIFYMSSFALISAFPYTSSTLSVGDYLQTFGAAAAPGTLKVARVISSLPLSVLSANELGFTTLVELESPPPNGAIAGALSVLRPGTALLGDTSVSSGVGLGGRTDVYIKGDSEQKIVGTAALDLSEVIYRGSAWSMQGNVVTVALDITVEQNQLKRYQHIILKETAYTISAVELANNSPQATIYVFDADVTDSGDEYYIVDRLHYSTAADFRVLSPRGGGELRLSCIIGSAEATLLGADLTKDGVRQGDIVEVPSLGIRRSIFSVESSTKVFVDNAFQQTLSDVGARVIRFIAKAVSPMLEFDVPSFLPQHPLSVDVEAVRAEIGEVGAGTGNILLPLGDAVARSMAATQIHTIFADRYNSLDYHAFSAASETERAGNRLAPASRGYLNETPDDLGLCSVLVAEPVESNDVGIVPNGVYEMRTWCDLFTRNANNIFVLRGDTRTSARMLDFPGGKVMSGDVLRITSGYMAGDYVIESVLHNTLVRAGRTPKPLRRDGFINELEGEFTYADITTETLDDDIWYQKVSFVRIYGEFPKNPMAALAGDLAVELHTRHTETNPLFNADYPLPEWSIGSVSSAFLNAFINGRATMLDPNASARILSEFREALTHAALPAQVTNDVTYLGDLFEQGLNATYKVIRPSSSLGRVKTRMAGSQVVLARPAAPRIDVDNLIEELYTNSVREITHRGHTELTGSVGTYHLSPRERYYTGGKDLTQWQSETSPALYSDRTIVDTFVPSLESEYVLFDSLIDAPAGGQRPVILRGPSSVTTPYMRYDGTRLIRYPEQRIASSHLTLSRQMTALTQVYFACPAFSVPDLQEIYIRAVGANENGQLLQYLLAGTDAFEAVIAELGDAVDGTGTPLETIYRQQSAIIRFDDQIPDENARLVALYGQLVEAVFDTGEVSDEFVMGSMLPTQGFTLTGSSDTCIPIAVATVSQRADRIEIVPSTTQESFHNIEGSRLRIDYRDTVYWRRAAGVDGSYVYLDEPLPFGTPAYEAYGICMVDLELGSVVLVSDPIFAGGDLALDAWEQQYTTHLNTGGVSRLLTSNDIGKHITLWGYRTNQLDYTRVLLDPALPELNSESDFFESLMLPERETFGQFLVTDVVPTFGQVMPGATAVPIRIDVEVAGAISIETPRVLETQPTKLLCAFVITSAANTLEEDRINNVVQVTAFAQEPYEYNIVGISKSVPNEYLAQPIFGSYAHGYALITDQLTSEVDVSTYCLTQDHTLEPTTIETDHLVVLTDADDIVIRTTNAPSSVSAESMHADGEAAFGYTCAPRDVGTSKSVDEDIVVSVPCTPGPIADTLAVSGYFDPSIGQAQSLVDSTNERPVCADILIKTLHQAYIGLTLTYVGGPSQAEVRDALSEFIKSRVLTDTAITRSKIISLVMNMGASTVDQPIDLYVCFEDNLRRIHKRTIADGLKASTLFSADVTLRTMYPTIAVDDRLGASIDVTRLSQATATVGNGGS